MVKKNFFKKWQNYKLGFGDALMESWLGLGILHTLLNFNPQNELLIKMESVRNVAIAHYGTFKIGDEESRFALSNRGFNSKRSMQVRKLGNAKARDPLLVQVLNVAFWYYF